MQSENVFIQALETPGLTTGPIKHHIPCFNSEQSTVCDPGMEWIFISTSYFSD